MNTDRNIWITKQIKDNLELTDFDGNPLGKLAALLLFADVVQPKGLWDFKVKTNTIVGQNIRLNDEWYRYDLPGDIFFGYIGSYIGFTPSELHCGADFADSGKLCSGSDPVEDFDAVEAGIDLWKMAKSGDVTLSNLNTMFAEHPNLAPGKRSSARQDYIKFWPYKAGTFDDGESGVLIKHR
jgi:hypothetical protein